MRWVFVLLLAAVLLSSASGIKASPWAQVGQYRSSLAGRGGDDRKAGKALLELYRKRERMSPLRNLLFWSKAGHIYSSYKTCQVNDRLIRIRKRGKSSEEIEQQLKVLWDETHEKNSERMLSLCLSLRGFYLKTGQFLGMRHDFMPPQYCLKLSKLTDSVPHLEEEIIRAVIEGELKGGVADHFTSLDLRKPLGAASIAQVHKGVWRATGEAVAVKVQYPNAESLMTSDLKNIKVLAEFLQRTELKFDVLSAVRELQKQIANEFDFVREANNMDYMRDRLKTVKEVIVPRSIFKTKSLLVMTFVEGDNLTKLAEFKTKVGIPSMAANVLKKSVGLKLLNVLTKAWGEMIFEIRMLNADPHSGNICINNYNFNQVGLLDWGQIKRVSDDLALKYSLMIEAMNSRDRQRIVDAFFGLGCRVADPGDFDTVYGIAVSMLDTRSVPGYVIDPFSPDNALKKNGVTKMPPDLYFLVRAVQLFRGIAFAFDLQHYSVAEKWAPHAKKIILADAAKRRSV